MRGSARPAAWRERPLLGLSLLWCNSCWPRCEAGPRAAVMPPDRARDHPRDQIACVGLRAKTGRAVGVVLAGPFQSPQPITRTELVLATPEKPSLFQPYHEVMELPWDRAVVAAGRAAHALEDIASNALSELITALKARRIAISCVGIVGAPERNLAAIGSPHIRAHAAEGVLFRKVLEAGAAANNVRYLAFPERQIESIATARLGLSSGTLRSRLAEFGQQLGRPWRADEKASAMAAWLALHAME